MGEPGLAGARRFGDGACAEILHIAKVLAAGLEQDADQVDHMVGALDGAVDRPAHAHIGLHRLDLPDIAERLQMAGKVGPPGRDADAIAAPGERAHHMPPDEAGAAENGDQLRGLGDDGHAALRAEIKRLSPAS